MISLQPREQYTIVRQLGDPTDVATYYVQAVVRNSVDDSILKTVNLTDKGNRRFKATYEVPADVSGLGFYIDITTKVYSDSDYTTASGVYSDELEQYLVFDRIVRPGGGGGGGSDVDYKKIQKMLDAFVKKFPEFEETNLEPMYNMLSTIRQSIKEIKIPPPGSIDFSPVVNQLSTVEKSIVKAIAEKEVTAETDLSAIMEQLNGMQRELAGDKTTQAATIISSKIEEIKGMISSFTKDVLTERDAENESAAKKLEKLGEVVMPLFAGKLPVEKSKNDPIAQRVKNIIG